MEGDRRWYLTPVGSDVHDVVYSTATELAERNGRRQLLRSLRSIYLDGDPVSADVCSWYHWPRGPAEEPALRNAVDATHARLAKQRPRPWVVTIDGEWSLQQKAKALSGWTDGEFERLGVYDLADAALLDAQIYGDGFVHGFVGDDGRPSLELVWSGDLHVPPREEENRCVRTLYRTLRVDRQVLIDRYPELEDAIRGANDALREEESQTEHYDKTDVVLVVQAWRLGVGERVGRFTECVSTATLMHTEWKRPRFPFARQPWSPDPMRWHCNGQVIQMAGGQAALNRVCETIAEAMAKTVPHAFLDTSMGLPKDKIGNNVDAIYEFAGTGNGDVPLKFSAPPPVNEQLLAERAYLKSSVFENNGVSELYASAMNPAEEESGKARAIRADVESERFYPQGKGREDMIVDIARLLHDCAEEICESDDPRSEKLVAMGGKRNLEAISYADGRMTSEQYRMRTFPTSGLSATPAAKLRDIGELMDRQLIQDPDYARELLDFPDLDRYNRERSAGRDLTNKLIERALKGERVIANPYMPLGYVISQGSLMYDLALLDGASDKGLTCLSDLIGQANALQQKAQQAMQAQQPAQPPVAGPPADPGVAA